MVKWDGCLFNDDGDAVSGVVAGNEKVLTPTTQDAFLQSYGLSNLSMTMMARWMHACGFRYMKRKKHALLMVMNNLKQLHTDPYSQLSILVTRYKLIIGYRSCHWYNQKNLSQKDGFYYVADDGIDMVEYHVDASYKFEEQL